MNGHYIAVHKFSDDRWETMEIVDSLVLVNRIIMAGNERDTVIVNRSTNKILTTTPKSMFPIVDFTPVGDTVKLRCEDDLGLYTIAFIKTTQANPNYHFSNTVIDIKLPDYHGEHKVSTDGLKIKNLTVGLLKEYFTKEKWPGVKDSIYIEFDNSLIVRKNELTLLTKRLMRCADTKWVLCLNIDKRVPPSMAKEITEALRAGIAASKIIEAKNQGSEIVYIR